MITLPYCLKAAIIVHGHGCVFMGMAVSYRNYLQKQAADEGWPLGHSLSILGI